MEVAGGKREKVAEENKAKEEPDKSVSGEAEQRWGEAAESQTRAGRW